jgi:hypothetical protein
MQYSSLLIFFLVAALGHASVPGLLQAAVDNYAKDVER